MERGRERTDGKAGLGQQEGIGRWGRERETKYFNTRVILLSHIHVAPDRWVLGPYKQYGHIHLSRQNNLPSVVTVGVWAQSTWGKTFLPEPNIYVWKINKMSEFYTTFDRKIFSRFLPPPCPCLLRRCCNCSKCRVLMDWSQVQWNLQ